MRFAPVALVVLLVVGCARPPMAPDPLNATTILWGLVLGSDTGLCIVGATVKVTSGQSMGQSVVQTSPCSVWDYGDIGFTFKGLIPNSPMMLQVSAPGYITKDVGVSPSKTQSMAIEIVLAKSQ